MTNDFQFLNLTNAFLFAAAMEDPETCKLVLELILGRPIGPIRVQVERSMLFSSEFRYVRFDVYASEDTEVNYDTEMQNGHKEELPKRARFHQAEMDATFLKPGQKFNDLPASFVIFICTFDPFFSNLYRYTYTETCKETGEELGDGTCKIFLNTKGKNPDQVPKELIDFLKYVVNSTEECAKEVQDERILKLNQKLKALKKSRKLEEKYMTMQEMLEDQRVEGKVEGKVEGIQLCEWLVEHGRSKEIPKLTSDPEFYQDILEKYHQDIK